TEFGCTSYAFATCASDLSSVRTSRTTWNLSFGEYVRRVALPMGTSPVRASVSAPRTGRSTPQCSGVQLFGVISPPIAGPSPQMCNRHEQHFFSCDFVDELKGKASKEFSAKCPLEMRTQVRIGSDQAHRMIELIDELG